MRRRVKLEYCNYKVFVGFGYCSQFIGFLFRKIYSLIVCDRQFIHELKAVDFLFGVISKTVINQRDISNI